MQPESREATQVTGSNQTVPALNTTPSWHISAQWVNQSNSVREIVTVANRSSTGITSVMALVIKVSQWFGSSASIAAPIWRHWQKCAGTFQLFCHSVVTAVRTIMPHDRSILLMSGRHRQVDSPACSRAGQWKIIRTYSGCTVMGQSELAVWFTELWSEPECHCI